MKKSKSSTEKKIFTSQLLSEIVLVKDKLQYDIKHLQWVVEKASEQGKRDVESEMLYTGALKHIAALEGYIKSLSKIERCRITEIDLPSKHWTPENKNS